MREDLRSRYADRLGILEQLRSNLEQETKEALAALPHIDRVTFRVKGVDSFVAKAKDLKNDPPYQDPLAEIEDQVAGRVIVFFLSDLLIVHEHLAGTYSTLVVLREILADDGSIFVHLDYKKAHYIKVILDEVFGEENFINDIVWQRSTAHTMRNKGFVRCNDYLFFYAKTSRFVFNEQLVDYGEAQLKRYKREGNGRPYKAENLTFSGVSPSRQFEWRGTKPPPNRSWGAPLEKLEQLWVEGRILTKRDGSPRLDGLKIYLDETQGGNPVTTNWTDIERIGNTALERMEYPTQKPETLLERIIRTSSNSTLAIQESTLCRSGKDGEAPSGNSVKSGGEGDITK